MRYYALATDYDNTLATDGFVSDRTVIALERVQRSGRKLILVTGRELPDLQHFFPRLDLFERVVAENGALLYRPATREEKRLCDSPSQELITLLRQRHVAPLAVGQCIISTWKPHEVTVLEAIRDLGLSLQVIFNKDAVMILPSGVNKASGLKAALKELNLSPHNVVGIGDAENDYALLQLCECAVAVGNAVPKLKEIADWVTPGEYGTGVVELIERLLASDLRDLESRLTRHEILLGVRPDDQEVRLNPYGPNLLIAGVSGGGKTTLAAAFVERLVEQGYQLCLIDPEGDYQEVTGAVVLGSSKRAPSVNEVIQLLERPDQNTVVNLLGISLADRPLFFNKLFPALLKLRTQVGRPHWLIIDEAHHLLPAAWGTIPLTLPPTLHGLGLVTVQPERVAPAMLDLIDLVLAIGPTSEQTLSAFGHAIGETVPATPQVSLQQSEVLAWPRRPANEPFWFRAHPPQTTRQRHLRKYAEGEMTPDRVFYFRGPQRELNLRAQNLITFIQIAEGIDDRTW
ncbi:MAG TPA: HAD family hydrolase, partial [Anaerolineae bacterium]|nr:HAD family hydrolase [Anaerolineae bacterium]